MKAEEARDLFSGACDEELSEAERAAFEGALAQDPALRSEYDDFCAFVRDTAALASDEFTIPQVDLLPAVQRKISERSRGRYFRGRMAYRGSDQLMTMLIIALIMICLGWTIWLGMSMIGTESPADQSSSEGGTPSADFHDVAPRAAPPPSLGAE